MEGEGQERGLPLMLEQWRSTLDWQPDEGQQAQFQRLYGLILEGNRQFNLTRITEPEEFWEKHLWDSLRGIRCREITVEDAGQQNAAGANYPYRVVDIGTGAGFPGIPVAIAHPTWVVALLDSTRKKMAFLDTVLQSLGIENAITLTARAEAIGQAPDHREQYDLALVRAVASASVGAEYALPLLKLGGVAVLYRGQWTAAEADLFPAAVAQLGGAIAAVESFTTPLSHGIRHCLYLKKIAPTPTGFPRPVGVPVQKPL